MKICNDFNQSIVKLKSYEKSGVVKNFIYRAYRCNELPIRKDDSPIKMRLRRMKLRVSPTADEVWEDRLEHFMCNPPPLIDERDNSPPFTSRPAPSLPVSSQNYRSTVKLRYSAFQNPSSKKLYFRQF